MSTRHVIKDKRIRLLNAIAGVVILLMMFVSVVLLLQRQSLEGIQDYSDGWTVVYHGKRYVYAQEGGVTGYGGRTEETNARGHNAENR